MAAVPSIIIASLLWSIATQLYSVLGRRMLVRRLNLYKSVFSLFFFFLLCLYQGPLLPPQGTILYLLGSGILGFALGDLCIFYSFSQMGAARTLMISSFVPGILAIQSFFLLSLDLSTSDMIGLTFMIACIFFLSIDKMDGVKFNYKIAAIALLGFSLDALGIILSKKAFMTSPELSSSLANLYRILTAVVFLVIFNLLNGVRFSMNDLSKKDISLVALSSFIGTFLALLFWLHAISQGHPATMAALGAMAPVYAAVYEYGTKKTWPSWAFFAALATMAAGVYTLVSF